MAKTRESKPKLSAAERLLESKRKHVKTLRSEIAWRRQQCEEDVKRIESRIRISQTLIDALEKGTLKP